MRNLFPTPEARKKLLSKLHESHSHKAMSWQMAKTIWHWKGLKNEIHQSNLQCGKCLEFSQSKISQKPILPLELCEYGPRELLNMDLFEREAADPEQSSWLVIQRGTGYKPRIPVPIRQPDLLTMPYPIKLIRKVLIIFFGHISLIVAILSLTLSPYFPETVKSTVGRFKESILSLAIWLHRA